MSTFGSLKLMMIWDLALGGVRAERDDVAEGAVSASEDYQGYVGTVVYREVGEYVVFKLQR